MQLAEKQSVNIMTAEKNLSIKTSDIERIFTARPLKMAQLIPSIIGNFLKTWPIYNKSVHLSNSVKQLT